MVRRSVKADMGRYVEWLQGTVGVRTVPSEWLVGWLGTISSLS